jgi:hypothetical protein
MDNVMDDNTKFLKKYDTEEVFVRMVSMVSQKKIIEGLSILF